MSALKGTKESTEQTFYRWTAGQLLALGTLPALFLFIAISLRMPVGTPADASTTAPTTAVTVAPAAAPAGESPKAP